MEAGGIKNNSQRRLYSGISFDRDFLRFVINNSNPIKFCPFEAEQLRSLYLVP